MKDTTQAKGPAVPSAPGLNGSTGAAQNKARPSAGDAHPFDQLFHYTRDAVVITSLDGEILDANPACLELFGGETGSSFKGRRIQEFYAEPEEALEFVKALADHGVVHNCPLELNGVEGRIHALITAMPRRDGQGRVVGYQGIVRDVTLEQRALRQLSESETRYRALFELASDAIFILRDGWCVDCNDRTGAMFGCGREAVVGRHIKQFHPPAQPCGTDSLTLSKAYQDRALAGEPLRFEWRHCRADGSLFDAEVTLSRLPLGRQRHLLAVVRDITRRKRAQEKLQESLSRFQSLADNAPDIIYTAGLDGAFTYVNAAWRRSLGHDPAQVIGRYFVDFVEPSQASYFINLFKEIRDHKQVFTDIDGQLVDREGRLHDFSMSGSPNLDARGNVTGIVGVFKDVSQRKNAEEQVRFLAYHDVLTGLPNRKAFFEKTQDVLVQSRRRTQDGLWALLFLDLDRFKDINDTLGHEMGDEVIKAMGERLRASLRESDHIFRLGGDEYTIVLTNLSRYLDAAKVAQALLREVGRPLAVGGLDFELTASIGISVFPNDGATVEAIVKNADMAMYEAKAEGNRYRFFTEEMNSKATERMRLESSLRRALQDNQLVLYYQPLVDGEHRIVGVEALIRWQHPDDGLVAPNMFIPLAEETGIIVPMGQWVLTEACRQTKRWHALGFDRLFVAVNLSARQFRQPNLVEAVAEALRDAALSPHFLKLEITESSVMEDPEQAIATMRRLTAMGVQIVIDDFGTGYSSLSYLKRFPVTTLKIDRSFVRDATTNNEDREIIKTIIAMARNLRMHAVAEGVETRGQRDFLDQHGCGLMQGYFFGRPVPATELEAILAHPAPPLRG